MPFAKNQLLPDENLIIVTHQHALVLVKPVVLNIVSLVILGALAYALDGRYWILLFDVVPLFYLLWEIIVRRSLEYIVTDRRVVRQEGVFTNYSYDASLDKINNVFHEQSLLGRVFGFGSVGLETASEQGTTLFEFIPDPVRFKNSILSQREKRLPTAGLPPSPYPREDIPALLQNLAGLRDSKIISESEFEAKKKELLDKL